MRYLIKLINPDKELYRLHSILKTENNFYWRMWYQLEMSKILANINKLDEAQTILQFVNKEISTVEKDEDYIWLLAKLAETYAENYHIEKASEIINKAFSQARELKDLYNQLSAMIRILQIAGIFLEYNTFKETINEIFDNIKNIDDPLNRLEALIMLGSILNNELSEYKDRFINLVTDNINFIQDRSQRFQIMSDFIRLLAKWNFSINDIITVLNEINDEYWRFQAIWDATSGFFESGNIEKMIKFAETISGEHWEKVISPEIASILINPTVIIDVQDQGKVNEPYFIKFYTIGSKFNIEPLETWVDLTNVGKIIGNNLEIIKYIGNADITLKSEKIINTKVKINIALGNLRGHCWIKINIK
ncbi:MAG: hypothetical protein QW128_04450 [Thermoprotei archaeon]